MTLARGNNRRAAMQCLVGSIAIALVTIVCFQLRLDLATTQLLYLMVIVMLSLMGSLFVSAALSLIAVGCLAYFFATPSFSFRVSNPLEAVGIVAFVTTSAVVSQLVSRLRKSAVAQHEQVNLLNLTHDSIIVRDNRDLVTYWNRGAEEFYGWTADEVVGKATTHGLLQTVFPTPIEQIDAELLRAGRWEGELTHTKRDGSRVVVASRWSLQRDEQRRPLGILELNNDITERQHAEDALRRQANLLEQTHEAIIVWEFRQTIIFWNRGAEQLYGFSKEEAIGRIAHDLLKTVHPLPVAAFEAALEREGQWKGELTHTARDGRAILVESRHVLIREADGRRLVLETNHDVTERRRAEESLRQAQADLTRVSRVTTMGELTASLAHEVNQPIAAALTNANTCLLWLAGDHPNIEEARAAAMRIVKDGTRAGEIISRTRLLFTKGTAERQPVDVNEIIREMIVLARSEALRCAVTIRVELAADLPQILGDRVQLQQVLMNLIVNGVDAMKEVDRNRDLTITSQRADDGGVLVSVSDTGVGLPEQGADDIFKAFFTTKPQGTGMGLSISRSIVDSHGGRLWAANNASRGASFHIALPLGLEEQQ